MAKPATHEASPKHEPSLSVVKPRRRRAAPSATPAEPAASALKPLLVGVAVGSAVVLAATALQASGRQGPRQFKAQPSIWNALTRTVAVALAQMVAKKVGRDLAERALPALADRALAAFAARR